MMQNRLPLLALLAALTFRGTVSSQHNLTKPTVSLTSGAVVGTKTHLPASTTLVHKFLGVPFAASPPERFSPPEDPPAWDMPLDASSYRPTCIQQFNDPPTSRNFTIHVFNNPNGGPLEESEDCLYLNVITPSTPSPTTGRAVMLWIFGGGLQFGGGSLAIYDGSSFAANQDVIIVTFNYRTNIFGFSNSPDIPFSERNVGLLDQRKALSWVTQNIAAFGGDPLKVTIFGESAGGWSVKQLLASPPSPLPFRAAIMESEAETLSGNSTANWLTVVDYFNCTSVPSPTQCLRNIDASALKMFIEMQGLNFSPVYDNTTARSDVRPSIASKTFAQVPFFLGTNFQEGRSIAPQAELAVPGLTDEEFLNSTYPNQPALQSSILRAYTAKQRSQPYGLPALVLTDGLFLCPASIFSTAASANGYDAWRYYYNASFPNTQSFPDAGVYHASEISEVFGTYPRVNATVKQARVSREMQKIWADFAKNPEAGPGWARLSAEGGKELGVLGVGEKEGRVPTIALNKTDFICGLYAAYLDEIGV